MKGLDLKNLRTVERLLLILGCLSMVFFAAGYFFGMFFFICFLAAMAALFIVWIGFWKSPHCGRRLWYNFDAPCRGCQKNVFEEPEKKPKNTAERTGFFGW